MAIIEKATHYSHPEHELKLKKYQKPYTCDGCKEQGFGLRYSCEQCPFDLHKDCMFPTPTTSHEFFKGRSLLGRCLGQEPSTFKFFDQSPTECNNSNCDRCRRYCDACGKAIYGFVYHCEEKGWDLHPCCRNLMNKLHIDGVKFRLRKKVSSKCIWCNKTELQGSVSGIRGWSYVSECKEYNFHVYCAREMVIESWKKGTKNNNCMASENLELPIEVKKSRNGGGDGKYLRIVKVFLKTIACILLGDPTITLACLLVDLVSK